jgi:hypothetical protein
VAETGFNSSPKTKATLFRAKKPTTTKIRTLQESTLASLLKKSNAQSSVKNENEASAFEED